MNCYTVVKRSAVEVFMDIIIIIYYKPCYGILITDQDGHLESAVVCTGLYRMCEQVLISPMVTVFYLWSSWDAFRPVQRSRYTFIFIPHPLRAVESRGNRWSSCLSGTIRYLKTSEIFMVVCKVGHKLWAWGVKLMHHYWNVLKQKNK